MNWLLSLSSGALLLLLFPPFGFPLLAPFALAPLLVALAREFRPSRRFLLGYAAGNVYWFAVCYWIAMVLDVHGGLGPAGGWATFLLFCLAKSIHFGLFGMLAGVLMRHWFAVPAAAAAWAVLERTQGPTNGFEWLMLGNAAAGMSFPLRLAPFTGVHGISFLFALSAGVLAMVWLHRGRKQMLWTLAFPLLAALPSLPRPVAQPRQTAVLVQPNVSETEDWTTETAARLKQRLALLSLREAVRPDLPPPSLIAWPELPAPIYYGEDHALTRIVADIARTSRAPLLLGTVAYDSDGMAFNSAQLVSASGEALGRYDKIYLVPFGEYVPKPFFWVNRITQEAGDFKPGTQSPAFAVDGMKIGVFICYESAVSGLVRKFAQQGAEVFYNLSNDGYFFRTAAREQHLLLVRMRAAENRRWTLRATNNGITAAVDPAGRVTQLLPSFEEQAGRFSFERISEMTLYTRWGDWFVWLCALGAGAALIASQWPNYTPPPQLPGPTGPRGPALLTSNSSKPMAKAGDSGRRRKS